MFIISPRDQIGNLGHDLDIGLFEVGLLQVTETIGVGDAVLRWTGCRRFREKIVADRLQARLVDEAGQPDLSDVARGRRSRQHHRDLTLGVDGDAGRVLRDGDRRLHRVALGIDQPALRVHLE